MSVRNQNGTPREAPLTVRDTIQQAQALNLADRGAEALELLLTQRNRLKNVPPRYDAAIGRLLVRSRDATGAAEYLVGVCERLKPNIPIVLQRHLAMALLAAGRVEAAGELLAGLLNANAQDGAPGWAIRADCKAAIDAFRNRVSDGLDIGPSTPYRVLAQAEAMAASGDAAGAIARLVEHRSHWEIVPPEYESALSRLAYATRDRATEIVRLHQELQSAPKPARAELHAELGAALYELGRSHEAGDAFSDAITEGAQDLPLWYYVLADEHRARTGAPPIDTSFRKPSTFIDATRKLAYVAVPKNGSSLLKANLVLNSVYRDEYLAERGNIHDFSRKIADAPFDRDEILGPDYVRFTVLRDPHRRLLSAYLQKFVRRWRNRAGYLRGEKIETTIRGAQKQAGVPFDPVRSISFSEFVRYLCTVNDSDCNPHWLPQIRFVGGDLALYHHVGKVENLSFTLSFLQQDFGYELESQLTADMPIADRHIAKYNSQATLSSPHLAFPRELDALEDTMPDPEQFYTNELRKLVSERFAADIALYASA